MTSSARIEELRQKFDENPRRYFAPLANEYRKTGELAQAIEICRTHLAQQPGHMSGHIVLGQALYESGERDESQQVFNTALELDPENLIALRYLGDLARDTGDADSARGWYQRVLDADPRNPEIVQRLEELASAPASAFTGASAGGAPVDEPARADAVAASRDEEPRETRVTPAGMESVGFAEALLMVKEEHEVELLDLEPAGVDGENVTPETSEAASREETQAFDPHLGHTPAFGLPVVPPPAATFVTETMAELYLQQGFRQEALQVYRQLLAQAPHDEQLRAKVDALADEAAAPAALAVADATDAEGWAPGLVVAEWLRRMAAGERVSAAVAAEYPDPSPVAVDGAGAAAGLGVAGELEERDPELREPAPGFGASDSDDEMVVDAADTPHADDAEVVHAAADVTADDDAEDDEIAAAFGVEYAQPAPAGFGEEPAAAADDETTGPASTDDGERSAGFGESSFALPPAFATDPVFETEPTRSEAADLASVELDLGEPIARSSAEPTPGDSPAVDFDSLWAEAVPPTEEAAAASLFGATASLQDDPALEAQLAEASADDPESLDALFAALPTGTPAQGTTPVTPVRAQSFSFDQFFEEPMAADQPSEEVGAEQSAEHGEAEPEADLAEFHSWLSGLKKQ